MEVSKQPLLDYLKSENPVLVCDRCQSGPNTSSKSKTYLIPGRIDKWEDFDYDSLRSMYGGALHRVLKQEFSCKDFSTIPRIPFREPSDEDSLETLLTKWNQSVISEALSKAQPCLYKPPAGNTIYMAKGGQAYFDDSPKYYPDWAGIQPRPSQPQVADAGRRPKNVLPGDTKLSTKWSSRDIVDGLVQSEYTPKDWLRPLTQVYTYCVKANARYGYVITDKELVAIRIRPYLDSEDSQPTNDSQDSWQGLPSTEEDFQKASASLQETTFSQEYDEGKDAALSSPTLTQMIKGGRLKYKAISWSSAKTQTLRRGNHLTVNLALWWLHIMASVSSNIEEQYPPLREVAQPTVFGDTFALAETSENLRLKLPVRSRKRDYSTLLDDEGDLSDGSSDGYPAVYERSTGGVKRLVAEAESDQNRRRTRSMVQSQS